jgi:hypothetical protein
MGSHTRAYQDEDRPGSEARVDQRPPIVEERCGKDEGGIFLGAERRKETSLLMKSVWGNERGKHDRFLSAGKMAGKGDKQRGFTSTPPRSLKLRGGVINRLNNVSENDSQSDYNETELALTQSAVVDSRHRQTKHTARRRSRHGQAPECRAHHLPDVAAS